MINKAHFHNAIKNRIDKCSYPMYAVIQYEDINCTCFVHATKQAEASCKNCLGTGHKIKIKRIKAAINESLKGGTALGVQSSYTTKRYFIDEKYLIKENDLIIDDDEVYYIHRIEKMRGLEGECSHREVTGVKRKTAHDTILKNFKNIIKGKR